MLLSAILIGLWAGVAGVDKVIFQFHIHRPIVTGLVIGIILGDVTTGLITGATLELVWAGAVSIGGAQPPNVVIGGIIGCSLAIITKVEPTVAVGLAVPFAVGVQAIITLLYTVMSPIMHKFDDYAQVANIKGIEHLSLVLPIFLFILHFFIAFSCIYFGADKAASIISSFPEFIIRGLKVAGGAMPAIGFAMLLKIMWNKTYLCFFIAGFVIAAYLSLDILAIAAIAASIALYDYNFSSKQSEKEAEVLDDGI